MAYNVFISYETDTGKDYAEHLKHALEKSKNPKFNVFVAHVNLSSGDDWKKEIDSALEKSHFFIVIITALVNDSDEVQKECKKALKLNKRIIPLRYSKLSSSELAELLQIQQIKFKNDSELANEAIIAIRDILRKEKENIKIENDSEEFINRGNLFSNLMLYNKALEAYNKAIKLNSNSVEAWNNKGVSLYNLGRYKEALVAYNKSIGLNSQIAETWSNKGVILFETNRFEKALVAYNKAIRLNPNHSNVWSNRGALYKKIYNIPQALEDYITAIELDPSNAVAISNIGVILENMGFLKDSLELHIKATELDPKYPLAWYNKGLIMEKLEYPPQDSLDAYDNAIALNYNHQDVLFHKGLMLAELNQFEDALEYFNKTIKINPNHIQAWNNKGSVLTNLGRLNEALEAFNSAIKLKPTIVSLFNKFNVLVALDCKDEALSTVKIISDMGPSSPEEWYAFACLNSLANNKEGTLEDLAKAIDLDVKFKEFAKIDEVFKYLKNDKDFKRLIE